MAAVSVFVVDFEASFQLMVHAPASMSSKEVRRLVEHRIEDLLSHQSPSWEVSVASEPEEVDGGDVGRGAVIVNDDGDDFVYGEDTAWLRAADSAGEAS
jgi:hypothetical protein